MIRYKYPPSLYTRLIMSYSLETGHIGCKLGGFFKKSRLVCKLEIAKISLQTIRLGCKIFFTIYSLQTIKVRILGFDIYNVA